MLAPEIFGGSKEPLAAKRNIPLIEKNKQGNCAQVCWLCLLNGGWLAPARRAVDGGPPAGSRQKGCMERGRKLGFADVEKHLFGPCFALGGLRFLLTGNEQLKREGKVDQAAGKVKQAAEKAVDKVKKAVNG